jgi:hypothetical protein
MNLLRSVLAWLHRSWAYRLLEPLLLPTILLMHSSEHLLHEMPIWAAPWLMLALVLWLILYFVLLQASGTLRPRRDRSRPVLEQVANEAREYIPLEERVGLKRMALPPAPPGVARFIHSFGRPLPAVCDVVVTLALVASAVVLIANTLLFRGEDLNVVLQSYGLPASDLTRWDIALISYGVMVLASLRSWASNRRAELDGETQHRNLEAYG